MFPTIISGLRNTATTTAGLGGGSLVYLAGNGMSLPHDSQGWFSLIIALVLAILGVLAKDATTGSQP